MGKVKIRYYSVKGGLAFWCPGPKMRPLGFKTQALGKDGPDAWSQAERLNAQWDTFRKSTKMQGTNIKAYPPGSLGWMFEDYRQTTLWKKDKELRTREEWEYAWTFIEPVFGDIKVSQITLHSCLNFFNTLNDLYSQHKRHKIFKIFRALLNIGIAYKFLAANPSMAIQNTSPQGRADVWHSHEVSQLAEEAWRKTYHGLALAILIAYDTELSPVDVRLLTMNQHRRDKKGEWFDTTRAKNRNKTRQKKVFATISTGTAGKLREYFSVIGYIMPTDQPFIRNRTGGVYTKNILSRDFRRIRNGLFPGDQRQLRDMRRTGNVEAAVGGALPTDLSAKAANSIDTSTKLFETYTPVQLAAVRRADAARERGRKRLKKNE